MSPRSVADAARGLLFVLTLLFCVCAAGAAPAAELQEIVGDLQRRETADAWYRLAAWLARHARWQAAAHAGAQAQRLQRQPLQAPALRDRAELRKQSLLLARYRINAGDLDGAQEILEGTSRAPRWLAAEIALERDVLDVAERELRQGTTDPPQPADDDAAALLYCGESLPAAAVDDLLRARLALARGAPEEALILVRKITAAVPSFADARALAANVLEALGRTEEAIAELEALRVAPLAAQTYCPGVLLDRVLFNAANIIARSDPRRAESWYRDAIAAATAREREVADAIAPLSVLASSSLGSVLLRAQVDPEHAAPEARNNLAHLLLRRAQRTAQQFERDALVAEARELFDDVAANAEYDTPQYAYTGQAKALVIAREYEKGLEPLGRALALDPSNGDALDLAAAIAENQPAAVAAPAAVMLLTAAGETLPRDYVDETYGPAVVAAAEKAVGTRSGDVLLVELDFWRGDFAAARTRVASLRERYGASPSIHALGARVAAVEGSVLERKRAGEMFAKSLAQQPPREAWEFSSIRRTANVFSAAAAVSGDKRESEEASALLALATPFRSGSYGHARFPWDPRPAGLSGAVTASDGGALPGVTMTAEGPSGVRTTVTEADGSYRFPDLQPGTYRVTAELPGMTRATRNIAVRPDGATQDIALALAGVSEAIEVTANAPILDVTTTTTTTQFDYDDLPPIRHDIYSIPSTVASLPTDGLNVNGAFSAENRYVVDGVVTTEPVLTAGSFRDVVAYGEQLLVTTSGVWAERAERYPAIVSRTVGNDFAGTIETFYQTAGMRDAPEPVSVPSARRADVTDRVLRATVGGPLIRDRLWYFVNVDLNSVEGAPAAGADGSKSRTLVTFLKLTAHPTDSFTQILSADRFSENERGILDDVAGAVHGTETATRRRDHLLSTRATLHSAYILNGNVLFALRGGVLQDESSRRAGSTEGESIQLRDARDRLFASGGVGYINDGRTLRRGHGALDVSVFVPGHDLKFGGALDRKTDRIRDRLSGGQVRDLDGERATRRFWTLPGSELGAAAIEEGSDTDLTSAFVQDVWTLGRVALDLGLRWDEQSITLPSRHRVRTSVLQPRAGVVVDPFGDRSSKIVLRFDRLPHFLSADDVLAFGSTRRYASVVRLRAVGGEFVRSYGGVAAVDPDLAGGYDDEIALTVAHAFRRTGVAQVALVHRTLVETIEDFFCTDDLRRCIGNPGRGTMDTPRATRESTSIEAKMSNGRQFDLLGQPAELRCQVSYTWSRQRGNVESPDLPSTKLLGIDPYTRPAFDFLSFVPLDAPLARERRHRARAIFTLETRGFEESHNVLLQTNTFFLSGEPRARFGYSDLYGRPVVHLVPRGQEGRSPKVFDADASLTYIVPIDDVQLRVALTVENALNRQDVLTEDQRWSFREDDNRSPTPANPSYLLAMDRVAPRTMRLFARLTF